MARTGGALRAGRRIAGPYHGSAGAGGIAARNALVAWPTARWRPEALRIQGGPAQRKRPGRSRAL